MSLPTEVQLPFADGTYRFFLPLTAANELERLHGPMLAIEQRLRGGVGVDVDGTAVFVGGGDATSAVVRDVIRLALAGGNRATIDEEEAEVGPNRARELVEAYCFPARPLGDSVALAWTILAAAIYGNDVNKPASA